MTLVFNTPVSGSGTHALIIGIGAYPHLLGGTKELVNDPMGLGQLSSPPISAKAFCDWLCARQANPNATIGFNNPEAPLASVEMLLSPAALYDYGSSDHVAIDVANKANIEWAYSSWRSRLVDNADSIGVFYFCGHGVAAENHYLLAEDFGVNQLFPWSNAIDLSLTIRAIQRAVTGSLFFFIDACRNVPRSYAVTLGAAPQALEAVRLDKSLTSTSLTLLEATAEGELAFAIPKGVSRFTGALIRSLSGYGGRKLPDQNLWAVKGDDIAQSVNQILSEDDDQTSARKQRIESTLSSPVTFHFETLPTRDFIELNIDIWNAQLAHRFNTSKTIDGSSEFRKKAAATGQNGIKIFISCADVDRSTASKLYRDLQNKGQRPWLATESLLPGQNRKEATNEALRNSALFITLLSGNSVLGRGSYQRELREALAIMQELPQSSIFIIPARLDEVESPQEEIRNLYRVDLFPDYASGLERIMQSIDKISGNALTN